MTCQPNYTRLSTFTLSLFLLSLLVNAGCNTKPEKPAGEASGKEKPNQTATANPDRNAAESENVNEGLVVEGDLRDINWRSLIGQRLTVRGRLVVVDTYDLIRRGQVKIARDRLYIPTGQIDPNDADPNENSFEGGSNVAKVTEAQKFNDEAVIVIDDGVDEENLFPPNLFPELGASHPTVRIGSTLDGVTGNVVERRNKIYLVPTEPLAWTAATRPGRPEVGDAKVTVASFNVLNYFTTIDDGKNGARGADSEIEFQRQEAKLVAAIMELDADVIGLMELENNLESEKQLVAALNRSAGKEVFSGVGLPDGFEAAPGGDNAIRVGIIYRNDRVDPVGNVSMIEDSAFDIARTPIVHSFKGKPDGKPFTVVVNHFKSKGGSSRAAEADKNKGDGQGNYNATRRSQSLAICKYIDGLKDEGDEPRVLIIGDLNAYSQEDPIDALRSHGLVDLHARANSNGDEPGYSFIYYGQSGSLDHAMATESLAAVVTGIATWHINSDEPRFIDYNKEHNPELYEINPYRSSDHDPVLIGIGK